MLDPHRAQNLEDGFRERGLRRLLVNELKVKGIVNAEVLAAIGSIPRHAFFERAFIQHAYQDKAFPIGRGQTISQPYTVARQTELLEAKAGDRILEIGTGSGYQCAVLCHLGYQVHSIEYQQELHLRARHLLASLGYKPATLLHGDGSQGLAGKAPYAGIIVTAGAPGVPEILVKQLQPGGKLVIPVGDTATQTMLRITRLADGSTKQEEFGAFRFVPLRGSQGWDAKK